MDGSIGDRFEAGQLFRPASRSRAIQEFPEIVLGLKRNVLSAQVIKEANGNSIVVVRKGISSTIYRFREDDYTKIISVVKKIGIVFGGEQELIEQIKLYLSVEFQDRPEF